MAGRKSTTNLIAEHEYNRELKRIKQFLRRASKRGFIWGDNVIPKRPKIITEKSVAKLKRLTPDVLYKKGEYVEASTGELLSGVNGRTLERKAAAQKAKETRKAKKSNTKKERDKNKQKGTKNNKQLEQEITASEVQAEETTEYIFDPDDEETFGEEYYPSFTDIVLSNFLATLKQFPNAEGVHLLLNWYDRLIADNGRGAVAQMLQDGAANGLVVTWETVYKSTATKTYMAEMMNYLPDQGKFYSDQIMDMMEQVEWWEMPE